MSTILGNTNQEWIANMGLAKPDIQEMYYQQYGDQFYTLFDFVQDHGMMTSTDRDQSSHFEEGRLWGVDQVQGAVTVGVASTVKNVPLKNVTVNGVTTATFMQKNDIVIVQNAAGAIVKARVLGITVSGNDKTAQLIPLKAGQAIPVLADGDKIINLSNSWGEGTSQPGSRKSQFDIENSYLQIIKTTMEITGSAKTDGTWLNGLIETKKAFNREGNFVFHKEQMNAEYQQKLKIGQMFLDGVTTTNAAALVDSDGAAVQTTEGAFEFAATRGNEMSVALNAFTLNDFDTMEVYDSGVRGNGEKLVMSGLRREQEFNKLFKSEFASTDASKLIDNYRNENLKGFEANSNRVSRNFKVYNSTRNSYIFGSIGMLDNPQTFSASTTLANKYQSKALVMPFGKTKDSKTAKLVPYFGLAYKEKNGYNRLMEVWDDGSAKSVNRIGPMDVDQLYIRSHVGTKFACGVKWQTITG
jgi:hypothetical protein